MGRLGFGMSAATRRSRRCSAPAARAACFFFLGVGQSSFRRRCGVRGALCSLGTWRVLARRTARTTRISRDSRFSAVLNYPMVPSDSREREALRAHAWARHVTARARLHTPRSKLAGPAATPNRPAFLHCLSRHQLSGHKVNTCVPIDRPPRAPRRDAAGRPPARTQHRHTLHTRHERGAQPHTTVVAPARAPARARSRRARLSRAGRRARAPPRHAAAPSSL